MALNVEFILQSSSLETIISRRRHAFFLLESETTSTTMFALSYYLSAAPRCYHRVAEEIRRTFKSSDEVRLGPELDSCIYLHACVDETLRLLSPDGATFWREVEAGGGSLGATSYLKAARWRNGPYHSSSLILG
ncbi:hypothetical protein F4801DRAFT_528166 [Xylaria longipes]|nr:hypothetical protein F4801DRAFT_528166 [Xylaria longipes]